MDLDFNKYKPTLAWPDMPTCPHAPPRECLDPERFERYAERLRDYKTAKDVFMEEVKAFRQEQVDLEALFKEDAIRAVGLEGHEAAERAWYFAYQLGHSDGFAEVAAYLGDIAEVILGDDA